MPYRRNHRVLIAITVAALLRICTIVLFLSFSITKVLDTLSRRSMGRIRAFQVFGVVERRSRILEFSPFPLVSPSPAPRSCERQPEPARGRRAICGYWVFSCCCSFSRSCMVCIRRVGRRVCLKCLRARVALPRDCQLAFGGFAARCTLMHHHRTKRTAAS